jgi:uncharacterized protein YbcC (UPF0753/DUF2309 family)
MNLAKQANQNTYELIQQSIAQACNSIAPTWPLDQFIAVNPYWNMVDRPYNEVSSNLGLTCNSRLSMPKKYYRQLWNTNVITHEHLQKALSELNSQQSIDELISELESYELASESLPLLSDQIDLSRNLSHEVPWSLSITHQISQFCASYFDHDQADWHLTADENLYNSWRRVIAKDYGVSLLMHAPEIRKRVALLPNDSMDLIELVINKLSIDQEHLSIFLQTVLLRINGWAAWCSYLNWQAKLKNTEDNRLVDLLAIRLAWEYLIDDGVRHPESDWYQWQRKWQDLMNKPNEDQQYLHVWQRAHEISYQQPLIESLAKSNAVENTSQTKVQAAFCIDVRSEVYRRALEKVDSTIQTLGFAGFFGLPISYKPIGTEASRPQLPGLLPPALEVTETCGDKQQDNNVIQQRINNLDKHKDWSFFTRQPASAFTYVESLGLTYLGKLIKRSLLKNKSTQNLDQKGLTSDQVSKLKFELTETAHFNFESKLDMAEKILRAMSLTGDFAPIVLLIGHGSETDNNPHASGLDCGACCGQTGEVNARTLATLLNDTKIRDELKTRNIDIPAETVFIAGLHNTTTDEVTLFEIDRISANHISDISQLQKSLSLAGQEARRDRSTLLGLSHLQHDPANLFKAIKTKSNDWAETRPEWGLVNNASFIVAPRKRTQDINLNGRSFLHEYRWQDDRDYSVLELIMTAPMIVTHWINMQYFSSTIDNEKFGSGNKLLHNVVGGRIGVFEGNGGDLRIGLPIQSLYDGKKWMHSPLRLSVFIEAPKEAIEDIIHKHEVVHQLVTNKWLYLFHMQDGKISRYSNNEWIHCE